MKLPVYLLTVAAIFLFSACAETTRFPISSLAPAAEIKAKTKVDNNNNNVITVEARNLASPERIDPSSTAYVLWIETDDNQIRNLGQLINENAETATLTTITPYDFKEMFITAEARGNVSTPSGTEISRVAVNIPSNTATGDDVDYEFENTPRNDNTTPTDNNRTTEDERYRNSSDTLRTW
jgi:hypothetical protein